MPSEFCMQHERLAEIGKGLGIAKLEESKEKIKFVAFGSVKSKHR